MADLRARSAWKAERDRIRRERRAYWLSIGEVYLGLVLLAYAALGAACLLVGHA